MVSPAAPPKPIERRVREQAERYVAQGRLRSAAQLVDGFLASYDGGWGLWYLCAELSQRLGRTGAAAAAYRACARQLEAAGHHRHACHALRSALRLDPRDASLREELARLTRVLPTEKPHRPGRRPLEAVTDPHIPIFDILDDEARQRRRQPT